MMKTSCHKRLFIDLETFSSSNLSKTGVYKYAESVDFEILLLAYSFDVGEVEVVDLAKGEKIPSKVLDSLTDEKVEKWAFNATFERICLSRFLDLPTGEYIDPKSWYCTMVWSLYLGLPISLEGVGRVLGLAKQKLNEGKSFIRYFCMPCKATKTNGKRTRNLPKDEPEKWENFKKYNKRDVQAELEIHERLSHFPLPSIEWNHYHLDQEINDRGVEIDSTLVEKSIALDNMLREENMERAIELTGLENPNSPMQLKGWLNDKGLDIDSLAKKKVEDALETAEGDIKRVLELRQELSKSSVKKYAAMENVQGTDKRVRGLIQFYGASRTGRYSGRLIQVQNLRRNNIKDLELTRSLVRDGEFETIELLYDSPSDILSQLIRTAFIPKKDHRFIVSDFSAIEARVLSWLADESWRMEAFEKGEDIYCQAASHMFGIPVEKDGVNGHLRSKGKIAELACIAQGELVLTDKGLVPIQDIKLSHKLWDGESWVGHEGLIYQGEREVINYEGLRATKDHLVWIEGKSGPVQFEQAATSSSHLLQTGDGRRAIWLGENNQSRKKMGQELEPLLCTNKMYRMPKCSMDKSWKFKNRKIKRMPGMFSTKTNSTMVRQKTNSSKAKMRKPKGQRFQKLWRQGDRIQLLKYFRSRPIFNRRVWSTREKTRNRSHRQRGSLRKRQYSICHTYKKQLQQEKYSLKRVPSKTLALCKRRSYKKTIRGINKERCYPVSRISCERKTKELEANPGKVRVYDIRNVGKHNRFTVSGKLVHNCGYGGSVGALKAMGALDMGIEEGELQGIVDSWREANPNIVNLWWDIDRVLKKVIKTRAKQSYKSLTISYEKGILFIELPSGRRLSYVKPRMGINRFGGESITYEGIGIGRKWERIESYGAKFVENIIQAISRDILAEAMIRLNEKGFKTVMHIHDEVVLEVPENESSIEEINKIMSIQPKWAKGLILDADGFECKFYQKD